MSENDADNLSIMVSSTVLGREYLLDRVYAMLTSTFGYKVMMSHAGTVRNVPGKTPFESCLQAVEECDFFFSIIFPFYGTGIDKKDPTSLSITHLEVLKAIELNKPRIFLADDKVITSRRLMVDLGINDEKVRSKKKITLKPKGAVISDLKIIDMYNAAIRADLPLEERTDSWVQKYTNEDDIIRFVDAQFSDREGLKNYIGNHGPTGEPTS